MINCIKSLGEIKKTAIVVSLFSVDSATLGVNFAIASIVERCG